MQVLKSAILAILQKEQGWPCPISTGPQKALVGIEKLVLFYVALNPQKAWKDQLEVAGFLAIQIHIQTLCLVMTVQSEFFLLGICNEYNYVVIQGLLKEKVLLIFPGSEGPYIP